MQLRSYIMNRLSQYRTYSVLLSAACVVFVYTLPAHAATTTYDGCFERSTDGITREIWMSAPICTIALDGNVGDPAQQFTVKNLDPNFYIATDETTHSTLSVTHDTNALSFSVSATTLHTITVSPWGYDPNASDFWFMAISDNQPTSDGGESPNDTFLEIMEQIEPFHLPFLTDSGDLIGGSTTDPVAHEEEYSLLDDVFTEFAGTTFMVPGDHDARNDLDAYYSAYFGARDYTFVYGNTRFVAFNTTEDIHNEGTLTPDQLTWLETTLAAATEEHMIVLMQHPIIPPDWAPSYRIDDADLREQLATWFVEYGVELVIAGDAHGYDYNYIDEEEFPGLGGGFYQLINGGAGGTMFNYDGDNFFTAVHVTPEGIEHQRIDLPDSDFSVTYTTANDGTGSSVAAALINAGTVDIEYLRIPFVLSSDLVSGQLYASSSDGQVYNVTQAEMNGKRYGYVELTAPSGTDTTITIKEQRFAVTTTPNTVSTTGLVTFNTLPSDGALITTLQVATAENETTLTVDSWDAAGVTNRWTETTASQSATTFSVYDLLPLHQYAVTVNGKLRERVGTDENGVLQYTFAGKATTRDYRIQIEQRQPLQLLGVAPSADHSPYFHLLNSASLETADSFYVYESDLRAGISSVWIDTDGDGTRELATVPDAGTPGHVRIFRQDGEVIASVFPYGEEFTGGIELTAADIDGDGDQELLMAPKSKRAATVHVYDFGPGVFEKIDGFRLYKKQYTGGVSVVAGDLDDDGIDEVIVGARKNKKSFTAYKWDATRSEMAKWLTAEPFASLGDWAGGFSLAVGDINANGKDDVIVGSRNDGRSITVLAYGAQQNHLRAIRSIQAFEDGYNNGVDVYSANVNQSAADELLVTGRGGAPESAALMTIDASTKHVTSLGTFTPFGADYTNGLHIAAFDRDGDFRAELAVSGEVGEERIKVYDKRSGGYRRIDTASLYGSDFTGGLRLTESM